MSENDWGESMPTKHVYRAIANAAAKLSKEGIGKDRENMQQGYKFRGIDDVYNALAPILSAEGLCILPDVLSREVIERTSAKGNALFYVTVRVAFHFVSAEDGSSHVVTTYGEAMDSADKATNKAMSAAYKYAAMQAFCIPTEGDNDADATTHEVTARTPVSGAQSARDQFNALDLDDQNALRAISVDVKSLLKKGQDLDAAAHIEDQGYDSDHGVALWSLFESDERSVLKKALATVRRARTKEKARDVPQPPTT